MSQLADLCRLAQADHDMLDVCNVALILLRSGRIHQGIAIIYCSPPNGAGYTPARYEPMHDRPKNRNQSGHHSSTQHAKPLGKCDLTLVITHQ